MIKRFLSLFVIVLSGFLAYSQGPAPDARKSPEEYVLQYKYDAIREMYEDGVPASITLAQGILESDAGNSLLAKEANNHFGIKCHNEWSGPVFVQDDDAKNECFRKYDNVFQSYVDHSNFLKSRPRYAFLFTFDLTDYESWAYGLKAAGYATDPNYAPRLMKIIEKYKLNQYDTAKLIDPTLSASASANCQENYNKRIEQITNAKYSKPVSSESRIIKLINDRKCINAELGETIDDLSKEYDIDPRLLRKYNDISEDKKIRFHHGDIIFLQPKKSKSKTEFHTVAKHETMYFISQKYGIKLKSLYKKNHMKAGEEPKVGDKIWLRKAKKAS